jgi:hypothetical protein
LNYSETCISSARAAHDLATTGSSTQSALVILVMKAILTACGTPAFTATASISGVSTIDLQYLLEVLHTSGYNTSISSTTLTVNW